MPVKTATVLAAAVLLLIPATAGAVATSRVDGPTMSIAGDGGSDRYSIFCTGGLVKINGFDPDNGPANCADIAAFLGDTGPGDDTVDLTAVSGPAGFTHHNLSDFSTGIALGLGADIGYLGPYGGQFSGGGGNDQLVGSDERDYLTGGDGSDTIRSFGGPDTVKGGRNNDGLLGGAGPDALYGEVGADRIVGGPGNDNLFGGRGNDALIGGAGPDSADGHLGRDRCLQAKALRRCER
jgi:Ca2+-binding RTX toxin-like protein